MERNNQGSCSLPWVIPNCNSRLARPNQGAGASESWRCISCPALQALTLLSCCVLSLGWSDGGGGSLRVNSCMQSNTVAAWDGGRGGVGAGVSL